MVARINIDQPPVKMVKTPKGSLERGLRNMQRVVCELRQIHTHWKVEIMLKCYKILKVFKVSCLAMAKSLKGKPKRIQIKPKAGTRGTSVDLSSSFDEFVGRRKSGKF